MNQDGKEKSQSYEIQRLVDKLWEYDCSIDRDIIDQIIKSGSAIAPHLENILQQKIYQTRIIDLRVPYSGTGWFVVIHALYLLAHTVSERSLPVILEFLAQKQPVLDYWMHDLVDEDLWELPYLAGGNRIDLLEQFVSDRQNNDFSRLAVCTALVQIALHQPARMNAITEMFKRILQLEGEEADFIGLVASEVLDLKAPSLMPLIISALENNHVWRGLLTADEVEYCYENGKIHKRTPLELCERYDYFSQCAYFNDGSSVQSPSRERAELIKSRLLKSID